MTNNHSQVSKKNPLLNGIQVVNFYRGSRKPASAVDVTPSEQPIEASEPKNTFMAMPPDNEFNRSVEGPAIV